MGNFRVGAIFPGNNVKTKTFLHSGRTWLLTLLLMPVLAGDHAWAQAQQTPKPATTTTTPAAGSVKPVKFQRPNVGLPAVRLTGGSRGQGEEAVTLDVLTPPEVGMTTQEQPSLFWYQSKPSNAKFELTLLQDKQAQPLMRVQMNQASKAGIQRVRLAEHGAKLKPGVEYQWVVALITDPDNRSTDLVASGAIKRIEPSVELQAKVQKADRAALPEVYGEAGIWYDALSTLSDQIEANPSNEDLRAVRRDLLQQVGLKAAAKQ